MRNNNITCTTTDSHGNRTHYGANRFGSWLELTRNPNRRSAIYNNSPVNRDRIIGEIESRGIKIPETRMHIFGERKAFPHL